MRDCEKFWHWSIKECLWYVTDTSVVETTCVFTSQNWQMGPPRCRHAVHTVQHMPPHPTCPHTTSHVPIPNQMLKFYGTDTHGLLSRASIPVRTSQHTPLTVNPKKTEWVDGASLGWHQRRPVLVVACMFAQNPTVLLANTTWHLLFSLALMWERPRQCQQPPSKVGLPWGSGGTEL